MGKKEINPRTREMLRMKLAGESSAEIGKLQDPKISKQRVDQLLKPFSISKRYVLDGAEASQDSTKRGVKAILDKIVLKVKKFV